METDSEYILNRVDWSACAAGHTCYEWLGPKDKDGYGEVSRARGNQISMMNPRAHRFSYETFKGPIPKGMCVCHTCDNPSCVNPNHLWLGTSDDNNKDKKRKHRTAPYTGWNNKLTQEQCKQIQEEYIPYKIIMKDLAKKYGVCAETIRKILG